MTDTFSAVLSVGAKRNGGQETLLIHQIMDFANLGMLGVGNDSDTTAQYGGTGHAGDVGSGAKDEYGINTSIGTGNRIAQVLKIKEYSDSYRLRDKVKIGIIILQDVTEQAKRFIEKHVLESELANNTIVLFPSTKLIWNEHVIYAAAITYIPIFWLLLLFFRRSVVQKTFTSAFSHL